MIISYSLFSQQTQLSFLEGDYTLEQGGGWQGGVGGGRVAHQVQSLILWASWKMSHHSQGRGRQQIPSAVAIGDITLKYLTLVCFILFKCVEAYFV